MKRKKSNRVSYNAELFDKIYEFKGNENWQVPQNVFHEDTWQIQSLQAKKLELNEVKEQLSQFDLAVWSLHTKKRDPSTQIIKTIRKRYNPELLTQAWCKFYECLSRTNLIPSEAINNGRLHSLHLCEAPGGFISALNHYLWIRFPHIKLHWQASTLNPDYEGNPTNRMIPDDRLITFTKQFWLFGADHTGDIMKYYNYKWMVETVLKRAKGKIDLITADGSINCMDDPGDQERHVEHLHFCEVITALNVLETGGNFVLKIFTSFEDSTISLLYLLNCVFTSISIVKPATSKSGNSETYVVCLGYKGLQLMSTQMPQLIEHYKQPYANRSLFALSDIDPAFLTQIEECNEYFMRKQIRTINENIRYFGQNTHEYNNKLYKANNEIANEFLNLYGLYPIENSQRLVANYQLKFTRVTHPRTNYLYKFYKHKYDDHLTPNRIQMNMVFGRKLDQSVVYTKFAEIDDLNKLPCKVNIQSRRSLYNLCKHQLETSIGLIIIDCNDFPPNNNQSNVHHTLLQQLLMVFLSHNQSSDILIINLHLVSNFLVGLFYVLSQEYTIFFFKHGLLYLSTCSNEQGSKHNERTILTTINNAIKNVTNENDEFERDLLELVEYSTVCSYYWKCVSFYNSHLC